MQSDETPVGLKLDNDGVSSSLGAWIACPGRGRW